MMLRNVLLCYQWQLNLIELSNRHRKTDNQTPFKKGQAFFHNRLNKKTSQCVLFAEFKTQASQNSRHSPCSTFFYASNLEESHWSARHDLPSPHTELAYSYIYYVILVYCSYVFYSFYNANSRHRFELGQDWCPFFVDLLLIRKSIYSLFNSALILWVNEI